MVTFNEFIKRFDGLKPFVQKAANEILVQRNDEIVEMIKEQQHAGVNAKNKKMQTGYSSGYAKRRKSKGLQTRYVDLHFTGDMHKGLKVRPVKEGVDVRSEEPYEFYVRAQFPEAFSLTKKNAEIIANFVAEMLAPRIKKYLVK